jgi:hypothetical protein
MAGPECGGDAAVRGVQFMFGGLVGALGRHARVILAVAVVVGAVGAAGAVGWITAPIG